MRLQQRGIFALQLVQLTLDPIRSDDPRNARCEKHQRRASETPGDPDKDLARDAHCRPHTCLSYGKIISSAGSQKEQKDSGAQRRRCPGFAGVNLVTQIAYS